MSSAIPISPLAPEILTGLQRVATLFDAQLASDARKHDELGFARVDRLFGADDINADCGHICTGD